MTDEISDVTKNLYGRVIGTLDGQPGNIQEEVLKNVLASFALASMTRGYDPYSVLRHVYKTSKAMVRDTLNEQGMTTSLPRGAKAN